MAVDRREQRLDRRSRRRRRVAQRAARQVAAAAELGEERALGVDRGVHARGRRSRRAARSVSSSSARHSTASAPWPTCGSITDGSRQLVGAVGEPEPLERRGRDHDGVEVGRASSSRVAMLPRSSANVRSGRSAASCARRRTEPVATRAPRGQCVERRARRARRAGRRARAPPRARGRRAMSDAGRSLAECTARSARPSSTACCTSFTNMPVPPIAWMGTSVRWSPVVETTTSSASAPSSVATRSACQRASSLPRVATRSGRGISGRDRRRRSSAEQLDQRVGVELAPGGAGGVLHADGRLVQQLVDDAAGQLLDRFARCGVEGVELGPVPLELERHAVSSTRARSAVTSGATSRAVRSTR